MTPRRWNLSITYQPKEEPVRTGACTQTIRALLPHKCKRCKGTGSVPSETTPEMEIVCPRCHGTGIIQPTPKKLGDLISFFGWSGRPYWSPVSWRTPYRKIEAIANVCIFPWGIRFPRGHDILPFNYSGFHYSKSQLEAGFYLMWGCLELKAIAKADGIVPPTGEALRDVLISKNGPIPAEGIKAQILRWRT